MFGLALALMKNLRFLWKSFGLLCLPEFDRSNGVNLGGYSPVRTDLDCLELQFLRAKTA